MQLDRQATSIAPRAEAARNALLALEDGTIFRGRGLGAFGQALGEVCFSTSMTGCQEILTGPSCAGQIITHRRGRQPSRIEISQNLASGPDRSSAGPSPQPPRQPL